MSRRSAWERRADDRDDHRRSRPARPLPSTALWRWRYEVVVTSGVSGGVAGLVQSVGAHSTVAVIAATGAAMASTPWVRRVSVQVWWHVVTPHLFRRCCSDLGFWDGHGRLPAVLRTRTTRRGQRLTVWCSAGVSLKDLRRARDELATGLWAQDVEVRRHPRFGQLAVVTVVRDDHTLGEGWDADRPPGAGPRHRRDGDDHDGRGWNGSGGDEAAYVPARPAGAPRIPRPRSPRPVWEGGAV
jgi:hypothetical protein